jgi:hypothetical protein
MTMAINADIEERLSQRGGLRGISVPEGGPGWGGSQARRAITARPRTAQLLPRGGATPER